MHIATMLSFDNELQKIAYVMTQEKRKELPKSDFAQLKKKAEGMKGKYPMPDEQHARSALGFAKMHGDTAAYSAVRAKAMKKFPNMAFKDKKSSVTELIKRAELGEAAKHVARGIGHAAATVEKHRGKILGGGGYLFGVHRGRKVGASYYDPKTDSYKAKTPYDDSTDKKDIPKAKLKKS